MKETGVLFLVVSVAFLAATSHGQSPEVIQRETYRDVRQLRDDLEAEAARKERLEKSENVRETVQRPPVPEPQPISEGIRERLVLVEDRLQKLEEKKDLAVQQGKPDEDIAALDTKIEELQKEAAALRADLGLAPR